MQFCSTFKADGSIVNDASIWTVGSFDRLGDIEETVKLWPLVNRVYSMESRHFPEIGW